jgi:8-oxo-dGTP pyrophosphatase MutT (NUDIX family)
MFVFPGGRTERADLTAPRTGSLHAGDAERLVKGMGAKGSLRRAEALVMSAIRETHEETGLFIGKNGAAPHRRVPNRGAPSHEPACCRTCRRSGSSHARSRRPGGRAASTRASSSLTPTTSAIRTN